MKYLFVTLVPVVASFMAAAAIKNSKGTAKPHSHNGEMPIGEPRCGDIDSLDGTQSFWQLDPLRESKHQL